MVSNDLVKNILLKFKIDDRDLKKGLESLHKGSMGGAGGTAGSSRSLPDHIKQLLQLNREIERTGSALNKNLGLLVKNAKEIATVHIDSMRKKLDKTSEEARKRLEEVGRLRRSGASQEQIDAAERRATRTMDVAQRRQGDIREAEALAGSSRGIGVGGRLQAAGAVLGAAGQIPNFLYQRAAIASQYTGAVGNELVQRRVDAYQGNMLNAIMNIRNQQDMKAADFAKKQQTRRDATMGLTGAGGLIGAIGAGLGVGSVGGPLGMIAGALGGAAVYGAGRYFLTNQREQEKLSAFQQSRESLQAQSINPYLYQRFRENAPTYARANRLLQFNPEEATAFRQGAFGRKMDAREAAEIAMALRPQFGGGGAIDLTTQIQNARRTTGFDAASLTNMIATQARFGAGGAKEAQNNLEKVMTLSFSKGITDSGLVEKMNELVGAFQAAQTTPTDSARIASEMLSGIAPGQENNIRAIEAASKAQARISDVYQEGGYRGFMKRKMAADIASKLGLQGEEAVDFQMALSGKTEAEGRALIERYKAPGKEKVIDEALKEYDQFGERQLITTPSGRKALAAIKAKQARGEQVTDEDIRTVQTSIEASGTMKEGETAYALARRAIFGSETAVTAVGQEERAKFAGQAITEIEGGPGATAEGVQVAMELKGRGTEEQDIEKNIRSNMASAAALFKEQAELSKEFGDSVDITTQQAAKLSEALDNLVTAINKKTLALGGRVSTTSAGQKQ